MGKAKRIEDMSYDQAVAQLPQLQRRLGQAAASYSESYEASRRAYAKCCTIEATEGGKVAHLRDRVTKLQAIVDRGPENPRVIEPAMIENPSLTPGLIAGAIEDGEEVEAYVPAMINVAELIGGLARVKGITEEQQLAARKLRSLWEVAQIGGARAIDYGVARVDTSGSGEDNTELLGADARRRYALAVQDIGMIKASIVERVVIHDASLRDIAVTFGGTNGHAKRQARKVLIETLNDLVRHFGLRAGEGAKPRQRRWNDGQERNFHAQSTGVLPVE